MKAYQDITDRIIERLEQGDLVWRHPVKSMRAFPRNFNSGNRYSGANLIMTLFSGFDSPYWNTYKGWKQVNRQVKKGSRGTPVIGWKRNEDGAVNPKTGKKLPSVVPFGWTVFNFAQTEQVEGEEVHPKVAKALAALEQSNSFESLDDAERILDAWAETVPNVEHDDTRMYYDMAEDKTFFPPRSYFETEDEYYLYRFHEAAHSTGPSTRLKRFDEKVGAQFGSESYSKEELVAQIAAAMLAAETGVENFIEPTAAYIKGWIAKFEDDKFMFVSAAQQAAKAVKMILEAAGEVEPAETTELAMVAA